jgi:AbrB family looped-hinge helix DNA binding protein
MLLIGKIMPYNLIGKTTARGTMIPATTKMSSRGQIVIPEAIREMLHLEAGTEFLVIGKGDTVVLQRLAEPPWKQFEGLMAEAQRQGRHLELAVQSLIKAFNKMRRAR